ncbi:hypothetical protein [Bradyrhizobium sp. Leo170]|uniref:YncE family protein n=1 Tax=Bradyrhizobium sp. Leo170 TaxID=1571199 RepID=UPI00102E636A|nr:hypothetical protein [Bradyrhizobium sp. Leo170]TAI67728.1 hypothetical protein CWO89_01680 [Bradyrhizobium sp. Leo170]
MTFLRGFFTAWLAITAWSFVADVSACQATEAEPLQLEGKIPLADVQGRIDHMAIDLARHHLFVAALASNGLAVVDLESERLDRIVRDLSEPQGVGYDPATDTVYVANAGDGSVRLFNGADLSPRGQIELGTDADNVRIDAKAGHIFVGHGDGFVTALDTTTHAKVASAALGAHPESFQLDRNSDRIFVNVPNKNEIDVIDRGSGKQLASWPTSGRSANFAMALDHGRQQVLVAFRRPAEIGVFGMVDGQLKAAIPTCGDIDDLFVDEKRERIYVSCGEGYLDVLAAEGASYRSIALLATAPGARTSLFVPELDRLLLAVPARGGDGAAIWVYRPIP